MFFFIFLHYLVDLYPDYYQDDQFVYDRMPQEPEVLQSPVPNRAAQGRAETSSPQGTDGEEGNEEGKESGSVASRHVFLETWIWSDDVIGYRLHKLDSQD